MVENKINPEGRDREKAILLVSIFIAGLCSLIYELLIGTTSTYFLGDGVKNFSLTIGFYMASMGLGSYLSRFLNKSLVEWFILIEILLALFGGLSVPILYVLFAADSGFIGGMLVSLIIIGVLTGFEIPLLSRILSDQYSLRLSLSNVLSLDYVGALIATICFPFFILPFIGIFKTSLIFGLINLGIGILNIYFLRNRISEYFKPLLRLSIFLVGLFITVILFFSNSLLSKWEQGLYSDRIIESKQSSFQKIVLTKHKNDLRLFLNGNLQFSSVDEYRYHEVLVHVPLSLSEKSTNVLILGGGDGLAARELLKYSSINSILIVDLDGAVSDLCKIHPQIKKLNHGSLTNPRVQVVNKDAFTFLRNTDLKFDLIIADLPDPNNNSLARLYSKEFYEWLYLSLVPDGVFITQASSPVYARKAFWCISKTIEASSFGKSYPLHVYIPSFGDWGFVMSSKNELDINNSTTLPKKLKYLNEAAYLSLFQFGLDQTGIKTEVNTLDRPVISKYYEEGWVYWK